MAMALAVALALALGVALTKASLPLCLSSFLILLYDYIKYKRDLYDYIW